MATTIEAKIKESIQAFVQELDLLVRRGTLDSLRQVLDGQPARRGRPRGRRGPGRSPAAAAADSSKVAGHVRANPGQTVGQIARGLGVKTKTLTKAIKTMLAEKQLRKTGQRRGTRYFPPGAGRLPGAVARKTRAKRGGRGRKAKAA